MENKENDWTKNPALENIDAAKMQMLLSLANQGKSKSQNELLPFLMAAASKSKSEGTAFSREESDLIIDVLKQGKSPQEIAKIEKIRSIFQMMNRR